MGWGERVTLPNDMDVCHVCEALSSPQSKLLSVVGISVSKSIFSREKMRVQSNRTATLWTDSQHSPLNFPSRTVQ